MDESLNISALIESGHLELYVLGDLPAEEMESITRLAATHPEIREEIVAIEASLISYAEAHAPNDPAGGLLSRTLKAIDAEFEDDREAALQQPQPDSQTRILDFRPRWAWAVAASILVVSGAANLWLLSNWQTSEQNLLALRQEQEVLAAQFQQASQMVEQSQSQLAILQLPGTRQLELSGLPASPQSRVTLFWNPGSQAVLVASAGLEALPEGLQYQLWAIIDGQPVDAGLLSGLDSWQEMKNIGPGAQAFAITIEPAGGSASPTLDKMVVLGNV